MTIAKKILLSIVVLLTAVVTVQAQNAVAISSNPGPGLHVALNWTPHSTGVRYNIFRKNDGAASYPALPLNATPIRIETVCAKIRTLLITSPDSTDWKIVAKSLSDSFLFNPCTISSLSHSSEKYDRLLLLARSSMPIAMAAGLGYKDNTVVNGSSYRYKIVALNASNAVVGPVATDLLVTAGLFVAMTPPTSVFTEPGDDAVLVRWTDVTGAAGFLVERAPAAIGPYQRVNESHFAALVTKHLNNDTLIPSSRALLDYKRYTLVLGKDSTHLVNGIPIGGPKNNNNYYYRVSTLDLFMRPGAASAVAGPVTPRDSTDPSAPLDLSTTTDDVLGQVTVRWQQVVRDINGHWEYPDSTIKYRLYRFANSENPYTTPSTYLGELPTIGGLRSREFTDTDPSLRSAFGNKTWWYRLRSIDQSTNISQWSSAVSAIVKDITKPGIVKNLTTIGYEDYISVKWQPNSEPDIASYMVYRSLCHLGSWVDCSKQKDTCKQWQNYDPSRSSEEVTGAISLTHVDLPAAAPSATGRGTKLPCPCSGPFVFLGEITKDSVDRAISAGNFFFNDRTIPAGSPLCYAYWIKAKDSSDNLSGSFPIPSAAEVLQIKCERLRDRTPPENAIISALFAQAEQIRIEWIGPPTQDTRAYHVYRAEGTNPAVEPGGGAYSWVGGMTVELPPTMPVVLTSPYTAPGLATCDKISVMATPWMSQGFFEDKNISPKLTYWYKVVGIDYDGNETPLGRAAAISTFSFTRIAPDAPVITVTKQADPCAAVIKWSPTFDASKHTGFIVYRSSSSAGPFIPIVVSPVKDNVFVDTNVVKGQTYWYATALLMLNGRLSALSVAKSVTP